MSNARHPRIAGAITRAASGGLLAAGFLTSLVAAAGPAAPALAAMIRVVTFPPPTAYVTNYGDSTVSVVDLATNPPTVSATVALPAGSAPSAIAISPDGATAYVADGGTSHVTPIDLTTSPPTAGTDIALPGGSNPQAIAITPDGARAYVTEYATGKVTPIDFTTSPPTVLGAISVGGNPNSIAITPDGSWAYVTFGASGGGAITPIALPSDSVGTQITLATGSYVGKFAFSPDGARAYFADGVNGDVPVVATASQSDVGHVNTGGTDLSAVAVSPTGGTAYAADSMGNDVIPFDPVSGAVGTAVAVDYSPDALAYTPDGAQVAVVNGGGDSGCGAFNTIGSVIVVNASTDAASSPVCVGGYPSAIAVRPVPTVARLTPDSGPYNGGTTVTVLGSGFSAGDTVLFGTNPGSGVSVVSPTTLTVQAPASSPAYATPTVDVTVTSAAGRSAAGDADRFSYGRSSAYVINRSAGTVTPLVTTTAPQGTLAAVPAGNGPVAAALSPDGATLYVVDEAGGTVTPVTTSTGGVLAPITLLAGIDAIAITPDGTLAFVANGTAGTVTEIELTTDPPLVLPPVSVCGDPDAIAISPDGQDGYVACNTEDTVVPLDLASGRAVVERAVGAGDQPVAIAIVPDGSAALVVDANGGGTARGSLTPISLTGTPATGSPVGVGRGADAIAVTPDGLTAYVVNGLDDTVTPVTLSTDTSGAPIAVGAAPSAIAISADGTVADVANAADNTVTPVALGTGTPGAQLAVGSVPVALVASAAPVVDSVTPAEGSTAGGTQVALQGSGFTPGTQVFVGGNLAPGITVDSDARLSFDTPPGSGLADVTVVTAEGTSVVLGPQDTFRYLAPSLQPIGIVDNTAFSSVSFFAPYTNTLGSRSTVGSGPDGVAITPDRSLALVANKNDGTLTPLALTTTPPTAEPTLDMCSGGVTTCGPMGVAISPDGSEALVADSAASSVVPVDLTTQSVGAPIAVPSTPTQIAFAPDGTEAYVICSDPAASGSDSVVRLNFVFGAWFSENPVVLDNQPTGIAITPDGRLALIAEQAGGEVQLLTLATDPPTILPTAVLIPKPYGVAITPDGRTAYVSSSLDSVVPVDIATAKAGTPITVSNGPSALPQSITISPDGGTAYVADYHSNQVTPIATATNAPATPINLTGTASPEGIAVSTPVEPPYPPQDLQVHSGNGKLVVTWLPPDVDGGSAVTSYVVTVTGAGAPAPITVTSPTTTVTVTGLTDMSGYRVSVVALNAAGTGDPAVSQVAYPQVTLGELVPLPPLRILDTRTGNGTGGVVAPVGPNSAITLQVAGRGGVPATGAGAVVMNVTVTNTTGAGGYLSVYPAGSALPTASNLNFGPGATVPNLVTVKLGTGGAVSIYNYSGTTDVIADVTGYFTDGTTLAAARFNPLAPSRILDTRSGDGTGGAVAPIGPTSTITLQVAGRGGVPATGTTAVVMNVTATNTTGAGGFLTVYPAGSTLPVASNLNFGPGETVPNLVTVKLGAGGAVSIYNYSGTTDVIADVVGWYAVPGRIGGARFIPLAPSRILDTRDGTGTGGAVAPIGAQATLTLRVAGAGGVPATGATAVVMNVTATDTWAAGGYLTIYPAGSALPTASNLNFGPGATVPNLVTVKFGAGGAVAIYNYSGTTDVIADVAGWYNDGST